MRKFTVLIFAWNKSPSRKKCLLFTVKHVFTSNHCFTAIYLSSMPIAFLKPWHITQLFSELIQKRNDFSSVLTHKRCENTWHIEYVRERLWRNFYWLNSTTKKAGKLTEHQPPSTTLRECLLKRAFVLSSPRLKRSETVRINCPRTDYLSSSGSFLLRFLEYSSFFSLIS